MNRTLTCLLAAVTISAGSSQSTLTPHQLKQDIAAKGAKAVVEELTRKEENWESVLSKMESGSPAWLSLAPSLRKGTDAGGTEGLDFAVARALPKAPQIVLGLIGSDFKVNDVCTSPFIEAEPGGEERYLLKTQRVLRHVHPAKSCPPDSPA